MAIGLPKKTRPGNRGVEPDRRYEADFVGFAVLFVANPKQPFGAVTKL